MGCFSFSLSLGNVHFKKTVEVHIVENWKEFNKEEEIDFSYIAGDGGLWG